MYHNISNRITLKKASWVVETDEATGLELPGSFVITGQQDIFNSPLAEYAPQMADELMLIDTPGFMTKLSSEPTYIPIDEIGELTQLSTEQVVTLAQAGYIKAIKQPVEEGGPSVPHFLHNDVIEQAFKQPVVFNGKKFYRHFAWGSAIKRGISLAMTRDFFAEAGILRFREDAYRMSRAYLPNSTAGVRGKLRVKMVAEGEDIAGMGPIGDGFGYVRQSMLDSLAPRFGKIDMGEWGNSYSFMQRFTLDQPLMKELMPHIEAGLEEVSLDNEDFAHTLLRQGMDVGTKTRFAGVEHMASHPWMAETLATKRADRMMRIATTGGFGMSGGVFVPTKSDTLILPGNRFDKAGEYIITRYPVDGPGSIRVIEAVNEGPEAERVAAMEVVQYTLTNEFSHSFKGLLGAAPDEAFTGDYADYDLIVCVEDIKLCDCWTDESKIVKEPDSFVFDDAVLSITQWYNPGSMFGVPFKLAKDLNADYDGDTGGIIEGKKHPVMLKQAQALPQYRNPKLPKTKTVTIPGESRAKAALLSMANIVGIATNVVSTVLAVTDQVYMAERLGFGGEEEMHEFFMYAIKLGTDIFKTSADYRPTLKRLGQINTKLGKLKVKAPWTGWRDDDTAFRNKIPMVGTPEDDWTEWEIANAVMPHGKNRNKQDNLISYIARLALPKMELPPLVAVMPLSYFRDWAVAAGDQGLFDDIRTLMRMYGREIRKIDWNDGDGWQNFESRWQQAIEYVIARKGYDRAEFANAMWFRSHSEQRMSEVGKLASAVFVGMPDEAYDIAVNKPGLDTMPAERNVCVTGLKFQLPAHSQAQLEFSCPVKVVVFDDVRSGTPLVRAGLVAGQPLNGQVQPKLNHYPRNMVGLINLADNVIPGAYQAKFNYEAGKRNGGTWRCALIPAAVNSLEVI